MGVMSCVYVWVVVAEYARGSRCRCPWGWWLSEEYSFKIEVIVVVVGDANVGQVVFNNTEIGK